MKPLNTLLFAFALVVGCDASNRDGDSDPYPDLDSAVEAIATSRDIYRAGAAAKQLYSGGVPAINVFRKHLRDDRVIPSGFCTRSLNTYEGITMAEQSRWSIQDMIETGLPKVYGNCYYVLRNDNVEQWLDDRTGSTFVELQIQAATAQLGNAKMQRANGDYYASGAIEIIEERLKELSRIGQE